jgi:hypothetical protein
LNPATRIRPSTLPTSGVVYIPKLDYATFKLFHLSLIWRAGITAHQAFVNVRLGAQEGKLRKRLLESDPGIPSDYPFNCIALRDAGTGSFQDELIGAPGASRVDGHNIYTLVFGGVVWHYYVSSHKSGHHVPHYFGLDGLLILGVQNWTENPFVRELVSQVKRAP